MKKRLRSRLSVLMNCRVPEQDALKDALNRRLQRTVELETETDSSLLGGVVIRTEDTVIDDSVRGKLQKLAGTLQ